MAVIGGADLSNSASSARYATLDLIFGQSIKQTLVTADLQASGECTTDDRSS